MAEAARSRSRSPKRCGVTNAVSDLLEKAVALLAEVPPDTNSAHEAFEAALAAEPSNCEVLDSFGAFLSEEGDPERARELLKRSVVLRPEEGAEKYSYLAQMSSSGEEALGYYERAADLLQKAVTAATAAVAPETEAAKTLAASEQQQQQQHLQLARVHAAIAELYMTDLCDLPDAEERCETALERGRVAFPTCLELLATTSQLRKIQGRLDEARELALQTAKRVSAGIAKQDLIMPPSSTSNNHDLEDVAEAFEVLADEVIIQLCRTLIDLGHAPEARALLEMQLQKDDQDIQVWYLLAYCHLEEADAEEAGDAEDSADAVQECLSQVKKLCKLLPKRDATVWKAPIRDLLARCATIRRSNEEPKQQ